jgi:hypothetical protein
MENAGIFYGHLNILRSFGIINGHFAVVIWYISPRFGICIVSRKIWQPCSHSPLPPPHFSSQMPDVILTLGAEGPALTTLNTHMYIQSQGDQMSLSKKCPKFCPTHFL